MLKWLLTTLILVTCQLSPAAAAVVESEVRHTLSFPRNDNQYVQVRSEFRIAADRTDFYLPSWSPGSYLIRDYAANLENMKATAPDQRQLAVTKIAKNQWRIDTSGIDSLILEYDVWAGRMNVAESWVESSMALLNGAGLFMYSEQSRKMPQSVEVILPSSWSTVYTSLDRLGIETRFLAQDFDELVDSPILAGNSVEYPFDVNGKAYSLVLSTENRFWDGEKSAQDVAKIVAAQQKFWGVDPFDRKYLFLNLFMDKFGGLEHDHSTVMMCNSWQMRGPKDYIKWLGLVSHEFFHSWNVRRMRPQALSEYDYQQEVYTRELWLAEGLTSYYDNLLLFRGGLISVSDYFELLAEDIRNFETTPGREIRSAELSSFDTWIKHYKPDGNQLNNTISYYRKGALIGFVTDMEIRRKTKNRSSLDTVMREMYSRFGPNAAGADGYPPGAFEDTVESVAGAEVRSAVERLLQTTEDPDFDSALDWYGLALDRTPGLSAGEQAPAGMGVGWEDTGTALVAEHVLLGYSGAAAGVLPGDELLAMDGFRVTPENFTELLQKLRKDEQVELTLVRHGRLLTVPLTVGAEIPALYAIVTQPRINNWQKNRLEAWLGRDLKFVE